MYTVLQLEPALCIIEDNHDAGENKFDPPALQGAKMQNAKPISTLTNVSLLIKNKTHVSPLSKTPCCSDGKRLAAHVALSSLASC